MFEQHMSAALKLLDLEPERLMWVNTILSTEVPREESGYFDPRYHLLEMLLEDILDDHPAIPELEAALRALDLSVGPLR
jgi:hypothetical protein